MFDVDRILAIPDFDDRPQMGFNWLLLNKKSWQFCQLFLFSGA
jgi:hypothetical protein